MKKLLLVLVLLGLGCSDVIEAAGREQDTAESVDSCTICLNPLDETQDSDGNELGVTVSLLGRQPVLVPSMIIGNADRQALDANGNPRFMQCPHQLHKNCLIAYIVQTRPAHQTPTDSLDSLFCPSCRAPIAQSVLASVQTEVTERLPKQPIEQRLLQVIDTGDLAALQALLVIPGLDVLAAVNRPNHIGETAFHRAARNPNPAVLRALLAIHGLDVNAAVNRPNNAGNTPFHWVVWHDYLATLDALAADSDAPIHRAAANANPAALQALQALLAAPGLDVLAAVNQQNNDGNTPIHFAARNPNPAALHALLAIPGLNVLAAVNRPNNNGLTPLRMAQPANRVILTAAVRQARANLGIRARIRSYLPTPGEIIARTRTYLPKWLGGR